MARKEIASRTMQHHATERQGLCKQTTVLGQRTSSNRMEWTLGALGYVPPDTDTPLVDDVFRAPEVMPEPVYHTPHDWSKSMPTALPGGCRNWSRFVATSFIGKARSQGIPYNDTLLDMAQEVAQEAGLLLQRGYAPSAARWMAVRERLVVGFERVTKAGQVMTREQIATLPEQRVDSKGRVHNDRRTATERLVRAERAGRNSTGAYIRRMPLEDQLEDRFRMEAELHGLEVQDLLAKAMEQPHDSKRGRIMRKRFIRTVFGDRQRSSKERHSARAMMRVAKQLLSAKDKTHVLADIDRRYLGVFGEKPHRLFIRKSKCPATLPTVPAETTEALREFKDGDHSIVVYRPLRGGLSTHEQFDQHAKDRYHRIELPTREQVASMYSEGATAEYKDRQPIPPAAGPAFDTPTGHAIPTGNVFLSFGDRMASKPGRKAIQTLVAAPKARRKARAEYPMEPETAEQRFATVEREVHQLTGISGWDY